MKPQYIRPNVALPLPGKKASKILAQQHELESSGVSYPRLLPLVPSVVEGPWIEDVDGNVFLDFVSMAGSLPMGHNENLGKTFRLHSERIMTTLDYPTEARLRFLSRLRDAVRARLSWDVICHLTGPTGANAVEAALKLAAWKTGKRQFLFLEGSYHGMSAGAASVSDIRSPALPSPKTIRPVTRVVAFPSDAQSVEDSVRATEKLIVGLNQKRNGVAALILEPVQGEGGVRPLPDGYLKALQRMLRKHEVLLIVDEVQTGFGRCGRLFAIEDYGVKPDILTFSKAASGIGAPLAGIAFSRGMNGWPSGSHIGTFRGFSPAFASGEQFLKILLGSKLLEQVVRNGAVLLKSLQDGLQSSSIVGEIRGRGYLIGIDIVHDGRADAVGTRNIVKRLFERGLITEIGGTQGNVIRLLPPLNVTREQLRIALEILIGTLGKPTVT